MCGIAGFIDPQKQLTKEELQGMINALVHRGPDNQNVDLILLKQANVGLAHSRLSIIDLSNKANQPLSYKHLSIVFNGEIYNFNEVKQELINLGHSFSTTSDTEVILHAFEEWSVNAVEKFIGMFAFSIYDQKSEKVYFFKDRVGVKPLYYSIQNDLFLFSSELKGLMAIDCFEKEIDTDALGYFFQLSYIPAPHTIFENVFKLNGGEYLVYDLNQLEYKVYTYWDPIKSFQDSKKSNITFAQAKQEFKDILISASKYRLVADVPVGVFLSGGYDSSLVAAILKNETVEKIKTYTIGFDIGNNEAPFAKEIAKQIGTEHKEFYMTTKDAEKIINTLTYYYDEPFGDSSAIPTTFISQKAAKEVKVVLSADGGDELFFGYDQPESYGKYIHKINQLPCFLTPLVSLVSSLIGNFYPKTTFTHRKYKLLSKVLSMKKKHRNSYLFNNMFHNSSKYTVQNLLSQKVKDYSELILDSEKFDNIYDEYLALGYKNYLQNDILKKVDIATMTASIEGREPLLDHRLFEYAAKLPIEFKYDGKTKKRILKEIMYENYLPKGLMERSKTGFTVPIYNWLRTDLKYLLDNYCSDEALQSSKLLKVKNCRTYIDKFLSKEEMDETLVWKLLIFQMWYKQWM